MAILKKIIDAIKAPARKVWVQDLRTLFIDNPAAIHLWTYGLRNIAGAAPPHNHDSNGGELLPGSLLSLPLGPYNHEAVAPTGILEGLPLLGNSTYPTNPKLLFPALVTLPGGVSRLRGALLVKTGAVGAGVILAAVLRPLSRHNFKLTEGALGVQLVADLAFNFNGSIYYLLSWVWELAELNKIKTSLSSGRFEFCVYQKSNNLNAIIVAVLGAELWIDDDPIPTKNGPSQGYPPLFEITYSDILTGKILLDTLARKLAGRMNAAVQGVLGLAPGLYGDGTTVDANFKWSRDIKTAHSHRGALTPDSGGGFIADGAVLTYPAKASAIWPRFWQETSFGTFRLAGTNQVQGLKIHSGGALDATWLQWDFEIDLESGLGALDLCVALEPGNATDDSKLLIHAGVFDSEESVNLVTSIKCDYHNQESIDAGGLLVCEVEPIENEAWVPNSDRRLISRSVYSQNAKKNASSTSNVVQTTNAYRISKPIYLFLTHPAYATGTSPRLTGRYILRVRFSLPAGGAYDANARVLAFEAVAAKGY